MASPLPGQGGSEGTLPGQPTPPAPPSTLPGQGGAGTPPPGQSGATTSLPGQSLQAVASAFFPHSADHGESLFVHPSTNRGGTPNALNGEPVSSLGTGRHTEGNGPSRLAEPRRGGGLGRSGELTPMARKTSGSLRSASPAPRPAPTSY